MDADDHSRTIIHIDLDCFYAQVEMVKNPNLCNVPLGIQQKSIVVTSNYIARDYGITKCMLISEAIKLCPNLVLVNGEDLHDYRQISYQVTNLLQKYTHLVERLGLDENFIDVTKLVKEKLKNSVKNEIVGEVFGDTSENCLCGCNEQLTIGTIIAQEIRNLIKTELNLTSCAGIAHNKLLAKIVGSKHKPNQQTVIFPNSALELMLSLKQLTKIPGIGRTTSETLENINIKTIQDLQNIDLNKLKILFKEKSNLIYNLSYGIDTSQVKATGRPLSIGLEDSCKEISAEKEIKEKLQQLLKRLLILVNEDGRIPRTIKLTIRKFDKTNKISYRETKQCNINLPILIRSTELADKEIKIMATVMNLFNKLIDVKKSYHITLLGLSFTKFQDPPNAQRSIATFLRKSYEVQSITSIENTTKITCNDSIAIPSTSGLNRNNSDTEVSPLAKKIKFNNLLSKQHFINHDDCASPSKLRVADLSLSCIDNNTDIICPPNTDKEVFNQLPRDIQKELWEDYKRERNKEKSFCCTQIKKSKPNTLLNYFVKN